MIIASVDVLGSGLQAMPANWVFEPVKRGRWALQSPAVLKSRVTMKAYATRLLVGRVFHARTPAD
jgi:hypothetical protein